jgi:hypothetical protein
MGLTLELLPLKLAVSRLGPKEAIPGWVPTLGFCSITRTPEELSVVCDQSAVPLGTSAERDWVALKVRGPLDFGLTGILSSIAHPLAQARISIFAVSTFDTDYVLVKGRNLAQTIALLTGAGHQIGPVRSEPND